MKKLKDYSVLDIESIDDERFKKEKAPGKWVQESRVYLKEDVDAAIAELKQKLESLKAENEHLKEQSSCTFSDDCLRVRQLQRKLEDEREFGLNRAKNADYEIGKLNEKIIALEKSYKKLVKRFVHETSVAESYRSLVYKEDALKYQKVGNSEMYEELSKKSDKAYRHANRWRGIFRKMSQEANK